MKRFATFVFVFAISCCLRAQVVDTTVCEILKNPQSFNGKIVRVKGTVVAGFDQFVVKGAECGLNTNKNIWLAYPEGTKAKAGPAVVVHVQPAHNFAGEVAATQRTPVEIDKNSKDFKQFDSLLAAPFKKGTAMCLGCNRYTVTATLVGRLDADEKPGLTIDKTGKITGFGGFGHMNAYRARLVLQSVADVTPKEIDYSKALAITKADTVAGVADADALAAARKLVAGYGPDIPIAKQLQRAVDAFGKPNENNGVVIGFAGFNIASAKDEGKGTADSPDGVLYTCTFNKNRLADNAESRALVFAGENIANLRNPLPEGVGAGLYDLEMRAWVTTVLDSFGSRQKTLTLPGGYVILDSTWAPAEVNQKVDSAIQGFLSEEELLHQ